ncbi:MAG: VWA domain-containing protein [Terracidiphilus sp.]|nr:VWA domain-containing protein [Terracidiphilus sp.]
MHPSPSVRATNSMMNFLSSKAASFPVLSSDRRRFLLGAAAFSLSARSLFADQQEPTLTVTSRLVNVYATVRDRNGALVQNLKQEDFTITEDGRPQTLSFFSRESDLPLTLGLLVDTSPSEARMIDQEREASRTFLRTVLDTHKDAAFLFRFDNQVTLLAELTNSLAKLDKALDKLDDVEDEPRLNRSRDNQMFPSQTRDDSRDSDQDDSRRGAPSRNGGNAGGSTHLFDAVYLASRQILKPRSGRKALIVIGDGDDMGSSVTQARAIRAAQQADALIYCIRIVDKDFGKDKKSGRRFHIPAGVQLPGIPGIGGMGGPGGGMGGGPMGSPGGESGGGQGPGGGPGGPGSGPSSGSGAPDRKDGKKHMEALSSETGGALFEVSKKAALGDIFLQIQTDLRSQYSLAYRPQTNALPGYRRIQVAVKKKNLTVQAREGYYADSED